MKGYYYNHILINAYIRGSNLSGMNVWIIPLVKQP